MSELVKKLEKYLETQWDENLYLSHDPHYKDGFTDCLELLKGVIETCEEIDAGMGGLLWLLEGEALEEIPEIISAALEKLNKDLE